MVSAEYAYMFGRVFLYVPKYGQHLLNGKAPVIQNTVLSTPCMLLLVVAVVECCLYISSLALHSVAPFSKDAISGPLLEKHFSSIFSFLFDRYKKVNFIMCFWHCFVNWTVGDRIAVWRWSEELLMSDFVNVYFQSAAIFVTLIIFYEAITSNSYRDNLFSSFHVELFFFFFFFDHPIWNYCNCNRIMNSMLIFSKHHKYIFVCRVLLIT